MRVWTFHDGSVVEANFLICASWEVEGQKKKMMMKDSSVGPVEQDGPLGQGANVRNASAGE